MAQNAESPISVLSTEKLRNLINFHPTEAEWRILKRLKRFNYIVGGKRVGKTITISYIALAELLQQDRNIWVVAPSYDLADRIADNIYKWVRLHFSFIQINESERILTNKLTRSTLELKSSDKAHRTNLKGKPLSLLIMEEAGDQDDEVWQTFLQPNVSQSFDTPWGKQFPRVIFIGNAEAKNFFYDGFRNPTEDALSLHLPTAIEKGEEVVASNNPDYLPVEELKRIKARTPYHVWCKDYLAQFREDEGFIFKNLSRVKTGELRPFNPKHEYLIGWDPAKHKDFNVVTVVDRQTHEIVAFSRSNKLDYVFQKERLKSYVREYGYAKVIIDSTGLGEPLFDELVRTGFSVTDYHFTQKTKQDLIEKLALLIEHGRIRIPPVLQELHDELEFFGVMKDNKLKYEAPSGKHDDCVMSLALACWELEGEPMNDKRIFFQNEQLAEIRTKTRHFQYR